MQYLEELSIGDSFQLNNSIYILCTDYKRNGDRLAVKLSDGSSRWLSGSTMVDRTDIFTLDNNNNIVAIRTREKETHNDILNKT